MGGRPDLFGAKAPGNIKSTLDRCAGPQESAGLAPSVVEREGESSGKARHRGVLANSVVRPPCYHAARRDAFDAPARRVIRVDYGAPIDALAEGLPERVEGVLKNNIGALGALQLTRDAVVEAGDAPVHAAFDQASGRIPRELHLPAG